MASSSVSGVLEHEAFFFVERSVNNISIIKSKWFRKKNNKRLLAFFFHLFFGYSLPGKKKNIVCLGGGDRGGVKN